MTMTAIYEEVVEASANQKLTWNYTKYPEPFQNESWTAHYEENSFQLKISQYDDMTFIISRKGVKISYMMEVPDCRLLNILRYRDIPLPKESGSWTNEVYQDLKDLNHR